MDTSTPFPRNCVTRIRYLMGSWITVTYRIESLSRTVVMMRRYPTYDDAQRFAFEHTTR